METVTDAIEVQEQSVDQFLQEIDMHYLNEKLKKDGFSSLQEFTKRVTLDDLKMMVGRDADKLYSALERKYPLEISLYKLTDS